MKQHVLYVIWHTWNRKKETDWCRLMSFFTHKCCSTSSLQLKSVMCMYVRRKKKPDSPAWQHTSSECLCNFWNCLQSSASTLATCGNCKTGNEAIDLIKQLNLFCSLSHTTNGPIQEKAFIGHIIIFKKTYSSFLARMRAQGQPWYSFSERERVKGLA